jgi:hypothetical protein
MKVCSVNDGESNFLWLVRQLRSPNNPEILTGEDLNNRIELQQHLRLLFVRYVMPGCCTGLWHMRTEIYGRLWSASATVCWRV